MNGKIKAVEVDFDSDDMSKLKKVNNALQAAPPQALQALRLTEADVAIVDALCGYFSA